MAATETSTVNITPVNLSATSPTLENTPNNNSPITPSSSSATHIIETSCHPYEGRFQRLKQRLGKGANKEVFLAFDSLENVDVAWNRVPVHQLSKSDKELLEQGMNMSTDSHPNVICYKAHWETDSYVCFITDYWSCSLKEYISERSITVLAVKKYTHQILDGLVHLHDQNIMHRDIKAENIFVNQKTGEVVIGDLGLSRKEEQSGEMHRSMSMVGTLPYMAPEQLDLDQRMYTSKVDIYALGMTIIEMITKQQPYDEVPTFPLIIRNIMEQRLPKNFGRIKEGPTKNFISRCLERDPKVRPSAMDLLEDAWVIEDPGNENDKLCETLLLPIEPSNSTTNLHSNAVKTITQPQNATDIEPNELNNNPTLNNAQMTPRMSERNFPNNGSLPFIPKPGSPRTAKPETRRHQRQKTVPIHRQTSYRSQGSRSPNPNRVESTRYSRRGHFDYERDPDLNSQELPQIMEDESDQDHNEEIEKENAERNFWKNHKEQLQEISNNIHETEIEELKSQPTLDKVVDLIAKFNKEIGEFVENTKDTDAEQRADYDELSKKLVKTWEEAHNEIDELWSNETRKQIQEKQKAQAKTRFDLDSSDKKLIDLEQNENKLMEEKKNLTQMMLQTQQETVSLQKQIEELQEQLRQKEEDITFRGEKIEELEKLLDKDKEKKTSTEQTRDALHQKLEEQTAEYNEELSQSKQQLKQYDEWRKNIQTFMKEINDADEKRWKDWSPEDIVSWICRLDNGVYKKDYEDVLIKSIPEKLEKGNDLMYLDMQTLLELGIKKIPHRKHILDYIKHLQDPKSLEETPSRKKSKRPNTTERGNTQRELELGSPAGTPAPKSL